jgi:hypothetical protein
MVCEAHERGVIRVIRVIRVIDAADGRAKGSLGIS